MKQRRRLALVCLTLVASCGSHQEAEPSNGVEQVWWEGDLVELDGERVSSGIKIEIEGIDAPEERGAVRYRLETGCSGSGVVTPTGEVQAMEVLRPCVEADVSRMGRLTDISSATITAAPSRTVSLRWDGREAVLRSSAGEAHFVSAHSRPVGSAETHPAG